MAQYAENYVNNLGEILRDISRAGELADSLEDKNKAKTIHGWGVILSGSIAPLVVGGPVGWGILGGAMLVGGVVRWISGASAHSRILRGIRKVINDGKMKVRSQIIEEIEEFTDKVAATISESIEQELDAFNLEMQAIAELSQDGTFKPEDFKLTVSQVIPQKYVLKDLIMQLII